MKKKRILYILNKKLSTFKSNRQHTNWVYDCSSHMKIQFWGNKISKDCSISALKGVIDKFRPDCIYMTIRKRYENWLPDLTSIKNVPKIFVEVDTCHYSSKDPWYKQFDILKCRCPWWSNWSEIPFFRWSVPEKAFPIRTIERKGIYFIGQWMKRKYPGRVAIKRRYEDRITFIKQERELYWKLIHASAAAICPSDHIYGEYIPAKLFEYLASGTAVITNCNMFNAGLGQLESNVIKYSGLEDIESKLDIDFTKYHNKAIEIMRENTHVKRYTELFK